MRLIKEKTSIDFLGATRRKVALIISALLIASSIFSLATRGLDFGIDFTGGVQVEARFPDVADIDVIRGILIAAGYEDAVACARANGLDLPMIGD